MGGSYSKNAQTILTNALSKISSEIVQKSTISQSSSQIISATNIKGDVVIKGNKMTQRVNLNMTALLDALSTAEAQQKLATELSQEAKSLTSGLNIGQLAISENVMNTFINSSIDIMTKIGQTCSSFSNLQQTITVENVVGSVTIENNVQEQITDILTSCMEKATSNNSALQDVITKISQSSSASAQGLSEWAIMGLLAVFIGIPVMGGVIGGPMLLKYIFPLLLVAGVVMIILYYYFSTTTMSLSAYSNLIGNTPACNMSGGNISTKFDTAERAANECLSTSNCVAYDWKGMNVNQNGTYSIINPPETTFYSAVSSSCQTDVSKDKVKMVRAPVVFSGSGYPSVRPLGAVKGDVYVDVKSTEWYQLNENDAFVLKGIITHEKFTKLTVSGIMPTNNLPGSENDYYIYTNPSNPQYWYVYHYHTTASQKWHEHSKVPGPGMYADAPKLSNVSGFKTVERRSWMLYSGIAGIVLGALGSLYMYTRKDKIQQ
jgi:hypothetical protein